MKKPEIKNSKKIHPQKSDKPDQAGEGKRTPLPDPDEEESSPLTTVGGTPIIEKPSG